MILNAYNDLYQVVAELKRRKVILFHACHFVDFESYLKLGGIPSRNLLFTKDLGYTPFDTDNRDRQNGTWNLVFFNLSDFGHWFSVGKDTIPNPFGPILLCFEPEVILKATDISITLKSAGAKGFDRIAEGIGANDVSRLFKDDHSRYIRFKDALRKEFKYQDAQSPEMSCSYFSELAPLSYLKYIIVDPYEFKNKFLTDAVCYISKQNDWPVQIFKRKCIDGNEARYQALFNLIVSGVKEADKLKQAIPNGSLLSDWLDVVLAKSNLKFQFERYAKYLCEGTVLPLYLMS